VKKSLLAVPVLMLAGCIAGPGPWHNKVGDYWNEQYQEQPILTTAFSTILPAYPFVYFIAWIPDAIVFNLVQFWGYDFSSGMSSGKGAAYTHENPKDPIKPWYEK
jgi:hypothetical protein